MASLPEDAIILFVLAGIAGDAGIVRSKTTGRAHRLAGDLKFSRPGLATKEDA